MKNVDNFINYEINQKEYVMAKVTIEKGVHKYITEKENNLLKWETFD